MTSTAAANIYYSMYIITSTSFNFHWLKTAFLYKHENSHWRYIQYNIMYRTWCREISHITRGEGIGSVCRRVARVRLSIEFGLRWDWNPHQTRQSVTVIAQLFAQYIYTIEELLTLSSLERRLIIRHIVCMARNDLSRVYWCERETRER